MLKVALQLREHDLPAEVLDFQVCWAGLANELVVRFDFFIRCFYQYFAMLVSEAHEGLSLAGHFTDRQSAFVQGFTHVQDDNGVHYVTEYLPPNGVCGPLGQRQQPEILFAGLNDSFNIRSAKVFCEQVDRLEFLVGKQHEVTEAHRHPVLLFILPGGVFLWVVKHVVALPLEGVVLVHINIGKDLLAKKFNLLPLAKVDVTSTDETIFPFVLDGLELVVERLEREAIPCRHPADKRLLDEVIAAYTAPVAKDAVQDMTQDTFSFNFIREYNLQHFGHSALDEKVKQEVRITKYGVDFGVKKNINTSTRQAPVIATDPVKIIGDGIIGHESSAGGKKYSGFAVRSQLGDLPETFAHNLSGMVFTSILDVLRLIDSHTAAENISVTVPHQFLNLYKHYIEMSYIVVLSSTTNSRNFFDKSKYLNYNFIENQSFSKYSYSA